MSLFLPLALCCVSASWDKNVFKCENHPHAASKCQLSVAKRKTPKLTTKTSSVTWRLNASSHLSLDACACACADNLNCVRMMVVSGRFGMKINLTEMYHQQCQCLDHLVPSIVYSVVNPNDFCWICAWLTNAQHLCALFRLRMVVKLSSLRTQWCYLVRLWIVRLSKRSKVQIISIGLVFVFQMQNSFFIALH